MNENTGNSKYQFFYDLLDNPADLAHSKASNIQLLINEFPQSGLLRSMLAAKPDEENLQSASAYVNPKLLYTIANAANSLRTVGDEQIVVCQKPGEAKPVLPLPVGIDLPNLDIDESNYFHVPIEEDLVYIDDETEGDIQTVEEDEKDTEAESAPDEVAAAITEEQVPHGSEETVKVEGDNEMLPPTNVDEAVAESDGNETDAVTLTETDTEVEDESKTEMDAVPSPDVLGDAQQPVVTTTDVTPSADTAATETEADMMHSSELAEEAEEPVETETDAAPAQEDDAEISAENGEEAHGNPLIAADTTAEDNEENNTGVTDDTQGKDDTPLTDITSDLANDNNEIAGTDAEPAAIGEELNENGIEADSEVTTPLGEVEETISQEDQPALSVEPLIQKATEEVEQEIGKAREEESIPQLMTNEAEAGIEVPGEQQDSPHADQHGESAGNERDTEIAAKPTEAVQEIDDEVFEEIVSIEDISIEPLAIIDTAVVAEQIEQDTAVIAEQTEQDTTVVADQAEQDTASNSQATAASSAGDSYFVFEPTLPEDKEYQQPSVAILAENAQANPERQRLSRYNDEKMPYSFMWWLDKTRKQHADIYQPFAAEGKFHTETVTTAAKQQPAPDHLQQQYVENIFAVSAAVKDLNVMPPKVDVSPVVTKVDKIIEKFIHEEPQIKHPSKVKLDSENKAKKSSEDRDELVTETLAKIYTEQMLYPKAILTYKKLMLKFPEKSLYFAGQIEQLEKKIN